MSKLTLGIIGGGQLGSMLVAAARKLNIKTIVFSDDEDAPAQKISEKFILFIFFFSIKRYFVANNIFHSCI